MHRVGEETTDPEGRRVGSQCTEQDCDRRKLIVLSEAPILQLS
jgi:hypothetical protein